MDFGDADPMVIDGVGTVVGGPDDWKFPSQGRTLAEAMCKAYLKASENVGAGVKDEIKHEV